MDRKEPVTDSKRGNLRRLQRRMQQQNPGSWVSGFPETPCGKGSMYENTEEIREFISHVIETYAIKSIADIGCGDQNWIHRCLTPDVHYVGYDIIPRRQDTTALDVSREVLPHSADLVLAIYVLNHMYPDAAERSLRLIRESKSEYLLMSFSDGDQYSLAGAGELVEQVDHKNTGRHEWFYGLWKI